MAYVQKYFFIKERIKAWQFLVKELNFSMREAQRAIDRKYLFCNDNIVTRKSEIIYGKVSFYVYEPKPKGINPIFENSDFAIFEKPSGVLSHPRNKNTPYSLNDEIKSLYGKNANVIHRLDRETSGLIAVSKHKEVEKELKKLFESREVTKKYIALVDGKIDKEFTIDEPILVNGNFDLIKLKVFIHGSGKKSQTHVKPICYFNDINATLIEATPITGRQHQIRVHMFHVKHQIIGDMLYGQSAEIGERYLDGNMSIKERVKLSRAQRLLLHASKISFIFKDEHYSFISNFDAYNEFYNATRESTI